MMRILNYIDGDLLEPESGEWVDVYNPALGEVYGRVADSGGDDVALAVAAAERAYPGWASTPAEERAAILYRIADRIDARLTELAVDECNDNGKPLSLATAIDIPRAACNFRFFAAAGTTFASESHPTPSGVNYTLRLPIGVVACISPWNLPLYLFSWKIAPALAVGNCVVGKPSEVTPLTAMRLAEICMEAGLPPGVLNIVQGRGATAGNALIQHDRIRAVSFTGGTATGAHLEQKLAGRFKKLSLELGGKNPNIVFADCDFDRAIETTVRSSFSKSRTDLPVWFSRAGATSVI